MLCGIQTQQLCFRLNPQFGKDSGDSDAYQRANDRNRNRNNNTDQLCSKQPGLAIYKAVPARNRIDICPRKQTGGYAAPDAADAMTSESIQRIVNFQLLL